MPKMTDPEISQELRTLTGWERQNGAIVRTFDCKTFQGSISFVDTIAEIAERADHHPDIDVRYNKVRIALSTHDAGGITAADVALARQITAAAA
jgi:4a-hydroxytetrahydrobiopterin dehydratase